MHPRILSFCLLLLLAAVGRQPLAAAPDDQGAPEVSQDISLDLPSHLIRSWYTRPDRAPFFGALYDGHWRTTSWHRLTQGWSALALIDAPAFGDNFSPLSVGIGMQKDLSKSSALRLGFDYSHGDFPGNYGLEPFNDFQRYGLSLDHLWNLSNHWNGYDPARSWEFLLVTGGAYGITRPSGTRYSRHSYWHADLGLQVRKTLSPRLSTFVEPYYYFGDTGYDQYQTSADFDDGFGFRAGLLYRVTPPLRQTPWLFTSGASVTDRPWLHNWYIQNLLGFNISNLEGLDQHSFSSAAYSFDLALGHWVDPAWGFRLGFSDRQLVPDAVGSLQTSYRQTYARLEGVLNLVTFFDRLSFGRIGANLSAGIEAGLSRQYQYQNQAGASHVREDDIYPGATAAMQLQYFLGPHTALLAEGRYSQFDRRSGVFTPSIGMEYYASSYPRYQHWLRRNREAHAAQSDTLAAYSLDFLSDEERHRLDRRTGNVFLELSAGVTRGANLASHPGDYNPLAALAIGVRFDSVQSLRLKDYALYHSAGQYSRLQNQLALDYLFNLTNFWFNRRHLSPSRASLSAFLGPVWYLRQDNSSTAESSLVNRFGFNVGLQHAFALTPGLELIVEPRYLYLINESNDWGLSAGAAYTFRHSTFTWPFEYHAQSWEDNWYFQNLIGYNQARIDDNLRTGHSFSNYGVTFALGRWVSPTWGYRMGVVDRQIMPNPYHNWRRTYRQTFARLEAVLNVPALWHSTSIGRLGIDLSAGVESGLNRVYEWTGTKEHPGTYKVYPGITAAGQLKYFVNSHAALVAEGRYSMFGRHAQVLTPSLGIEYYRSTYPRYTPWLSRYSRSHLLSAASDSLKLQTRQLDPTAGSNPKNLFIELSAALGKGANQAADPPGLFPVGEFAAGMHLDDYHSVRFKERVIYHRSSRILDNQLAFDYMFNASDYWFRHRPTALHSGARGGLGRLSFRPFAGLVYVMTGISTEREAESDIRHGLGLNFGIQHVLHLGRGVELFAEPRYLYQFSEPNQWSFSAGLAYTPALLEVGSWSDAQGTPGLIHNWYAQSLLGQTYAKVPTIHQGGLHLSRYSVSTAIGRWVTPVWGFRLAFADQQLLPDKEGEYSRYSYRQTYGRLEGVINVPALFGKVSWGRIGADLSGGFELGKSRYYTASKKTRTASGVQRTDHIYPGFTVAGQLKYFLSPNVALLGEARVSMFDRTSFVATPSLGLEFYGSTYPRYSKWLAKNGPVTYTRLRRASQADARTSRTSVRWSKVPRVWFVEADLGFTKHSNDRVSSDQVVPMGEIGVGVRLDTLSTLRIKDHLSYYSRAKYGAANFHNELAVDYMFDLTNFWLGAPAMPRGGQFAMRPFAGLVYSARQIFTSAKTPVHSFGANFGVQYALRINEGLELTAEPRYLALASDANHWSLSLGATYILERNRYRSFTPGSFPTLVTFGNAGGGWDFQRFYVQMLGGTQVGTGTQFYGTDPHGNFDLTIGHNLFRNLALQGTLFSQHLEMGNLGKGVDQVQGLRIEAAADALGMFWPEAHERGYAWTLQGGYDFARSLTYDRHAGPTVATQARRRLGHTPAWLALQGRLQMYRHSINYTGWTVQAGIHYELPDGASQRFQFRSQRTDRKTDNSGIAAHTYSPYAEASLTWYDANNLGYHTALGLDIHQLHGIRLSYDHSATPYVLNADQSRGTRRTLRNVTSDNKVRQDLVSLDYMYDLTTALLRSSDGSASRRSATSAMSDPWQRRLHLKPFLGVATTFHSLTSEEQVQVEHLTDPDASSSSSQTPIVTTTTETVTRRDTHVYLGFDLGMHVDFRLLPHLNVFVEQKALYLPYDPYLSPTGHHNWHLNPSAGIQLYW